MNIKKIGIITLMLLFLVVGVAGARTNENTWLPDGEEPTEVCEDGEWELTGEETPFIPAVDATYKCPDGYHESIIIIFGECKKCIEWRWWGCSEWNYKDKVIDTPAQPEVPATYEWVCVVNNPVDENSLKLDSMCVEEEYSDTKTKWRIVNKSGVDIEYYYEVYSTCTNGSGTVDQSHTMEERFNNPYYFYAEKSHPVTMKIYWGEENKFSTTKASSGDICEPTPVEPTPPVKPVEPEVSRSRGGQRVIPWYQNPLYAEEWQDFKNEIKKLEDMFKGLLNLFEQNPNLLQ